MFQKGVVFCANAECSFSHRIRPGPELGRAVRSGDGAENRNYF